MDTWEIGQKGEYLDHHVRFNVDVYYSNYDSIQLAQNVVDESTGGSTSLISNAGTGRIYGVEGEAAAIVGNLELNASFGTADARYTHIDPGVPYITLNTPFPETSKFTGFVAADYRIPTPLGKFDLHMDFNYKSRLWYGAQTNLPLDQPGFGIANGMIAFDFDHPRVQVSLWGRNLFDKKYLAYILDESSIGFVDGMPGDPFTFGMSAKYSF
jgi:iron complex outermembrane receptor protein